MKKLLCTLVTAGFVIVGCGKQDNPPAVQAPPLPKAEDAIQKPAFEIPVQQANFQNFVRSLPSIPRGIDAGSRGEAKFIDDANRQLANSDYVLSKSGFDLNLDLKTGAKGLTSISHWVCRTPFKHYEGEDYGTCEPIGMEKNGSIFWNRGSGFNPNKDYFTGDIIKVSGQVKMHVIYQFGTHWEYKIELVNGSFEVLQEGN